MIKEIMKKNIVNLNFSTHGQKLIFTKIVKVSCTGSECNESFERMYLLRINRYYLKFLKIM